MPTKSRSNPGPWVPGVRLTRPLLAACLLVITASSQTPPEFPRLRGEGALKVMTYNMDVGTDYAGLLDPNLDNFKQAATNLVLAVRASDPAGRTQAIAREIIATMPDLVSLQEVATVSTGTTKNNLTTEFDYLQLLLQALTAQGAQYAPVAWSTTWDATIPTTTGFARNIWSDVIIARSDLAAENLSFTNSQGGIWTATFVPHLYALDGHSDLCPVGLKADGTCRMPWHRGWASADVLYRGKNFRIVGAHLDSASPLLEIPQGTELLDGPANTSLPVVVAGDLNCDCSNPSDPTYATCVNFSNAGFIDSWAAADPSEIGYTKHLPVMSQRSDYVMVRGPFGVQAAFIVGDQANDMTQSGRWPSDHAGVVARLRLSGND